MSPDLTKGGTGHLAVEAISGQSAVTSVWATSPLKILVPRARGHSVWACLSSFGGGLVAGDKITLTLNLGNRARCFLSTQAATKVYRSPNALTCGHNLRAGLGSGSLLVFAPDPVQAFRGSHYRQRQEFSLARDSGLVLVDWLCSGRAECGERWAFQHFESRNEIVLSDSRVLLDSLLLDPVDGPLDDSYRMGRFNCLALLAVMGEPFKAASSHLFEQIASQPVPRSASLVCSASPVKQGALIRLAGETVESVRIEIHRLLSFLPQFLRDDPWARKW
jgi:urease accessory protein